MKSRTFILRESGLLALGEIICIGVMWGLFALLDRFDYTVLLGGILGGVLALGNFFFMAIASDAAADKAAEQDVSAGKKAIRLSYQTRLLVLGVLLFILARSGHCHLLALVCPLFFVFPILTVIEFFRKSGDRKA